MSTPEPVDLSPLHPSADPAAWDRFLHDTVARTEVVLERRRSRTDVLTLIATWSRPVTVGVGLILVLVVPLNIHLGSRPTGEEQVRSLVSLSVDAARGSMSPSGEELSRLLAGGQDR